MNENLKSDPSEIAKTWEIVAVDIDKPVSLRAIWPKGHATSQPPINKTFSALEHPTVSERKAAFEAEAQRLGDLGYNVYIVMNPIKSDFRGTAVRDDDIAYLGLLLIDIDRAAGTGQPAADEEVAGAKDLATAVELYLSGMGWAAPIRVMSGNGAHLYYRLDDVPNDDESTGEVRSVLGLLAKKFDTTTIKIDTSVFNASRITKVPGTIARKGVEADGRPYRMAKVL